MADKDNKQNNNADDFSAKRFTAILGLMADNKVPVGKKPDLKEIQDWHNGKLSVARANEVKSHVARDPHCYQMWSDLLVASTDEPATNKEQLQNRIVNLIKRLRFNPLWLSRGGFAVAVAAIVAIFIFPYNQDDWSPSDNPIYAAPEFNWPYLAMTSTRSGDVNFRLKTALQRGLREGLEMTTQGEHGWSVAVENLPGELIPCDKTTSTSLCEQQSQLVKKLGVHAAVLYIACLELESGQQQNFDENFWSQQNSAWGRLSSSLKELKIKPFVAATKKLQQETKALQCDAVRDLIILAY